MADPDHRPSMDGHDRLTVALYRTGLALAAVSLLGVATVHGLRLAELFPPFWLQRLMWAAFGASVALSAANLHLYAKAIRWVIASAAPLGLALMGTALALPATSYVVEPLHVAGIGFVAVTLSGLALKERFCFRIPFLWAVPVCLAGGLVPVLIDWPPGIVVAYGLGGVLTGILAVAKLLQPLDYDIGDKSAYEV